MPVWAAKRGVRRQKRVFFDLLLTFYPALKSKIDFKAVFLPVETNSAFLSGHKSDNLLARFLLFWYYSGSLNFNEG